MNYDFLAKISANTSKYVLNTVLQINICTTTTTIKENMDFDI